MKRTGFTLIELLIAISILVVIVMVVYASFSSVINTMDTARVVAEETRLRQFLERSFRTNLSAVYIDRGFENELFRFVGVTDESRDGPNDSLRFTSMNALMGGTALPGDLKEVRYGTIGGDISDLDLDIDEEENSQMRKLQSVETPLAGANVQEIDPETGYALPTNADGTVNPEDPFSVPTWSVPIRSIDFSYFDGQEWLEEWDTMALGRLPWCVRVRINFAKTAEQLEEEDRENFDVLEEPDMEVVVPLPTGLGVTGDVRGFEQSQDELAEQANEQGNTDGSQGQTGDPRDENEEVQQPTSINRPNLPRGLGGRRGFG